MSFDGTAMDGCLLSGGHLTVESGSRRWLPDRLRNTARLWQGRGPAQDDDLDTGLTEEEVNELFLPTLQNTHPIHLHQPGAVTDGTPRGV